MHVGLQQWARGDTRFAEAPSRPCGIVLKQSMLLQAHIQSVSSRLTLMSRAWKYCPAASGACCISGWPSKPAASPWLQVRILSLQHMRFIFSMCQYWMYSILLCRSRNRRALRLITSLPLFCTYALPGTKSGTT